MLVLLSVGQAPPLPVVKPADSRKVWLESLDGKRVISFAGPARQRVLRLLKGSTGLGAAPVELTTGSTPGAPGAVVEDVITTARPVSLPMAVTASTQTAAWAAVQELRDLVNPRRGMGRDGSFKIVCSSDSGVRELTLAYQSGLEGEDLGLSAHDLFTLRALAVQPFALDRDWSAASFSLAGELMPFLSDDLVDSWSTRQLVPSTITEQGVNTHITSSEAVYLVIEVTGPADGVLITADSGLRVDVPAGVGAGQTLRLVTDPRYVSIRLIDAEGEQPAAGLLARGSRRAPLLPGRNMLAVEAPGADSRTRLVLRWLGTHGSLW